MRHCFDLGFRLRDLGPTLKALRASRCDDAASCALTLIGSSIPCKALVPPPASGNQERGFRVVRVQVLGCNVMHVTSAFSSLV